VFSPSTPEFRMDPRVIGQGSKDPRFICAIPEGWTAKVEVMYHKSSHTEETVAQLLSYAGQFVGLCDWRPERKGTFGTFAISNIGLPKED